MLQLRSEFSRVYSTLQTRASELVDAISYRCTWVMRQTAPKRILEPLRVYILPEHELAPLVCSTQQLFDLINGSTSPSAVKCTIMGRVSRVSGPLSVPYGLRFDCTSCQCATICIANQRQLQISWHANNSSHCHSCAFSCRGLNTPRSRS